MLTEEIARDLRAGAIFHCKNVRHVGWNVSRFWFNYASGHYIADAGSCFLWADKYEGPWHIVSNSAPCNRAPAKPQESKP